MRALLGSLVLIVVGGYCIHRARREYRADGKLSVTTAIGTGLFYALYYALIGYAVWRSDWRMHLGFVARLIGSLAVAGGLLLFLLAVAELRSWKSRWGLQTGKLVTSGPYRWSRNPQNVGIGSLLLGVALVGDSGEAMLLALLYWAFVLAYLPEEERHLERVFGESWRKYKKRVPRLMALRLER